MQKTTQLILSLAMMTSVVLADAVSDKEAKAIEAAREWLSLYDQAKYDDSWEMASTLFKDAIKKEPWNQMAVAVRTPLGKLEKRDVKSQKYQTSVPGAPDGEYVIIQFSTVFENKKEVIETVTMILDQDRGWRVSGYFIQ